MPPNSAVAPQVVSSSQVPSARPKRGRRRKRPDLTDEQRKALRAMQNRQATRRSRERTRQKALHLKNQLSQSLRHNSLLVAQRNRLLAHVSGTSGYNRVLAPLHGRSSGWSGNENHVTVLSTGVRTVNKMSLDVILNHDHGAWGKDTAKGEETSESGTGDVASWTEDTGPQGGSWNARDWEKSPVSIASGCRKRRKMDQGLILMRS